MPLNKEIEPNASVLVVNMMDKDIVVRGVLPSCGKTFSFILITLRNIKTFPLLFG